MYLNQPPTPEDHLLAKELQGQLLACMQQLTPREERIIRLRYGFYTEDTLRNIAKTYDVTGNRIRQIECKAIRKLRRRLRHYGRRYDAKEQVVRFTYLAKPGQEFKEYARVMSWREPYREPPSIIARFPHMTPSLAVMVENEWNNFGMADAARRGIEPLEWMWRRSRKVTGFTGTVEESMAALHEWELNARAQPAS